MYVPLFLIAVFWAVTADNNNTNKFFDWVRSVGGRVDSRLELSTGPDPAWTIRGIFATEAIAAEEEIIIVPEAAQLCHKAPCGLIRLIREELLKGESSTHWPYLKRMEDHEIELPNVWTDEELELLDGIPPGDWTRHSRWFESACWPSLQQELQKDIQTYKIFMPDAVTWRALYLYVARITNIHDRDCFVPVYDNMNHNGGAALNTRWESKGTNDMHILALKPIAAGEQVWNSFGEGAGRMLRDYGFLEPKPTLWNMEDGDTECRWWVQEGFEEEDPRVVHWEAENSRCLEILLKWLQETMVRPAKQTENMRPNRAHLALKYRDNHIHAVRLAIRDLKRKSEL